MIDEEEFYRDIKKEVLYSRWKFPKPDGIMTALTEETGEVARAMLSESDDIVYQECVQVAATALRIAIEGDPTLIKLRQEFVKKAHDLSDVERKLFFQNRSPESKKHELFDLCRTFLEKNNVGGVDAIYDQDQVIENSYELIAKIANIVGYPELDEDESGYKYKEM